MLVRNVWGFFLTVILLSTPYGLLAQSYAESALLFSSTQLGGSARIQAMGGTQIALGGDYSSALSNPAGLGMFNRSEFTFSPALNSYSTEVDFFGTTSKENSSKFIIPGLSYVHHVPRESGGFLGGSFGISMTRTNNFNGSMSYQGTNELTSIVDYYLDDANGQTTAQFDGEEYNTPTGLAYNVYLIGPQSILDPPGPSDQYFTDAPIESYQQENIITEGGSTQWSFSYGANFNDMIFLGGGIGLTTLRYESQRTFSEEYLDTDIIDNIFQLENLEVRGSGINATLGVIARPWNFLQVGVSFITPTYYQISETYDAQLDALWNDFDYWDGEDFVNLNDESEMTDIVTSEYSLTTPLKLSAGLAFISKFGFISADIEMMNPAKAKYNSEISGISYSEDNEIIQDAFKNVYNFRVGAEFRYNKFRVRGGYNTLGSPYQNDDYKSSTNSISGGVGVRLDKFYVDLAIIDKTIKSRYSPYVLSDNSQPILEVKNKTFISMITLGFSF